MGIPWVLRACFFHRLAIWHTVPTHQEPVAIDTVGRASQQSGVVLAFFNQNRGEIIRLNHEDLVHLIGQGPLQIVDEKEVALFHLVDIGK